MHGEIICWSDGKIDSYSLPDRNNVIQCTNCSGFFWRKDNSITRFENKERFDEIDKQYSEAKSLQSLHEDLFFTSDNYKEIIINDYFKLLDSGFANTKDKEIDLRTKIWWLINDFIRHKYRISKPLQKMKFFFKRPNYILKERKRAKQQELAYGSHFEKKTNNLEKLAILFNSKDDTNTLIEIHRELGNYYKANQLLQHYIPDVCSDNARFLKKSKKLINAKRNHVFEI